MSIQRFVWSDTDLSEAGVLAACAGSKPGFQAEAVAPDQQLRSLIRILLRRQSNQGIALEGGQRQQRIRWGYHWLGSQQQASLWDT
jgi:hypothetical protein